MIELDSSSIKKVFVNRDSKSHKGDFGRVLIVAGSESMAGACVLCANAAASCGAGLVYAAFPRSQRRDISPRLLPEVMAFPLGGEDLAGFAPSSVSGLLEFADRNKISSCVIGPGLGRSKGTQKFITAFIAKAGFNVVADADALFAIANDSNRESLISSKNGSLILTPHAGEFAGLVKKDTAELNKIREKAAREYALRNNLVLVLKGHGTIVTDGINSFINTTGNPGLAKGGSGDVLSGIIGAYIAQVKKPQLLNAARAAAYMHGLAGDILAESSGEIFYKPSDLSGALAAVYRKIWK